MSKIHQLSSLEIHKIAAGQVIERPLNIIKELVENALDAGAKHITIHLFDGGKKRIEVVDNGCGMDNVDAQKCFLKHATSKIQALDQLVQSQFFGFRGEALAAIQAVARVTLTTKEHDALVGIEVVCFEQEQSVKPVACPAGTSVVIEQLFERIPVRKKFLKASSTEVRAIVQAVEAFALVYPLVHFTLMHDTTLLVNAPVCGTVMQKAMHLFDERLMTCVMQFEHHYKGIILKGIMSNHQYTAYDRTQIMIVVNNRWIKNYKLVSAVVKGYRGILPDNKFPFVFCHITVDPTQIDVNMHPKKEDISFVNQKTVEHAIEEAISVALQKNHTTQLQPEVKKQVPFFAAASQTLWNRSYQNMPADIAQVDYKSLYNKPSQGELISESVKDTHPNFVFSALSNEKPEVVLQSPVLQHTVIGVFKNTYLLIEKDDGLMIVDQHAAHERVLYERYAKKFIEVESISLLFAQIIELQQEYIDLIIPWLGLLQEHGMSVEVFGPTQLIVQAVPLFAQSIDIQNFILEFIGAVKEAKKVDQDLFQLLTHSLRALLACKAAVKAGDILSSEQIQQLLVDLQKSEHSSSCPHGRPTTWYIKQYDLEKNFKRVR